MTSMADLDLDELERLIAAASPRPWRIEPLLRDYLAGAVDGENRNVADMRRADAWLVVALANAAPALIAAARELDRLRALCRETHAALDGVVDVLGVMGCSCECEHDQGEGHDETCWRCEICRVYSLLVTSCLLDRLRAAGGGT